MNNFSPGVLDLITQLKISCTKFSSFKIESYIPIRLGIARIAVMCSATLRKLKSSIAFDGPSGRPTGLAQYAGDHFPQVVGLPVSPTS